MKKINGFTLVELLAVIVILAIIMVIAIPSVLTVMKTSKQKAFTEYVQKVRNLGEQTYLSDELNGVTLDTTTVYDIETDLGLDNTGDYHGYVLVVKDNNDVKYYVTLWNDDYMVYGVEYDDNFENSSLLDYTETAESTELTEEYLAAVAERTSYTERSTGTSNTVTITNAVSSTEVSAKINSKNSSSSTDTSTDITTPEKYIKTVEGQNGFSATYECVNGTGTIKTCSYNGYRGSDDCNGGSSKYDFSYLCTFDSTKAGNLHYTCNSSFEVTDSVYGGGLSATITC